MKTWAKRMKEREQGRMQQPNRLSWNIDKVFSSHHIIFGPLSLSLSQISFALVHTSPPLEIIHYLHLSLSLVVIHCKLLFAIACSLDINELLEYIVEITAAKYYYYYYINVLSFISFPFSWWHAFFIIIILIMEKRLMKETNKHKDDDWIRPEKKDERKREEKRKKCFVSFN